jgi:hypothetical protein
MTLGSPLVSPGLAECSEAAGTETMLERDVPASISGPMAKLAEKVGMGYGALRKECLEAVRHWPGCETIGGIQIIRDNSRGGFTVRVTLYGKANERTADRAINCVQREKRRHFHLIA